MINPVNKKIIWSNFRNFLFEFLEEEPSILRENDKKKPKVFKPKGIENSPYDYEKWNYENNKKYNTLEDPVKLGHKGWKKRYYEYHFDDETDTNIICENYIKSLNWTWEYYNGNICDWNWEYKFHRSPHLSDMYYYLRKNKVNIEFDTNTIPCTPFEQLVSILPKKSFKISFISFSFRIFNLCENMTCLWSFITSSNLINVFLISKFLLSTFFCALSIALLIQG